MDWVISLRRRCAAELVEGDAEPGVDIPVHGEETIAELPGAQALLQRLCLGGGAVFVGAADVEGVVALEPAEPGKYVGRENLDEIAEMGDVIDVG